MKGAIIINPYLIPKESVTQANRLKEEFFNLGVEVDIISNGFLQSGISNDELLSNFDNYDFIIYLDKDKYLSEILEKNGYKLFNKHDAIRICDDKAQTSIVLANKGIKLPDTIFGALCYREDCSLLDGAIDKVIERLSLPVIVKESFGSMGKGVKIAYDKAELEKISEELKLKPHLYQEYIGYKKGVDIRVIVIGKKAVCAMKRQNDNDFRSNIALGGKGEAFILTKAFRETAEKVAEILDLDYCGVDLLFYDESTPCVCEVNSNAFFNEIEKVTGVNVAKVYASYVIEKVK